MSYYDCVRLIGIRRYGINFLLYGKEKYTNVGEFKEIGWGSREVAFIF